MFKAQDITYFTAAAISKSILIATSTTCSIWIDLQLFSPIGNLCIYVRVSIVCTNIYLQNCKLYSISKDLSNDILLANLAKYFVF